MSQVLTGAKEAIQANSVLRNTYILLSAMLLVSALCAYVSIDIGMSYGYRLVFTVIGFAMLFVTMAFRNSAWGLLFITLFSIFQGLSIGPLLNHYLEMEGGSALVGQSLFGTAVVFVAMSAYALISKKNFSFMGGFLLAGLVVAILFMIANIFIQSEMMSLGISAVVILIMSALILYDTSEIIHGGETSYISATLSLYLSILNIFLHLLNILSADD